MTCQIFIYVAELGFEPASVKSHCLCQSLETSLEEVKYVNPNHAPNHIGLDTVGPLNPKAEKKLIYEVYFAYCFIPQSALRKCSLFAR